MKPTFTPAPVTMFCACGVDGSRNAVCVSCSASGSSSGLDGSDGQICWSSAAGETLPLAALLIC